MSQDNDAENDQISLSDTIFNAVSLPEVFSRIYAHTILLRRLYSLLLKKNLISENEIRELLADARKAQQEVVDTWGTDIKGKEQQEAYERLLKASTTFTDKFEEYIFDAK